MSDQPNHDERRDGEPRDHEAAMRPPKQITIRIDGRRFKVERDSQTAAELLQLAGLDPARYDLGEIDRGKPTRYEDEQLIHLHDGDKFVSIRQEAQVA